MITKLGLDFGTTNSAVAYLDEDEQYRTVPESGSEPTLLFWDDGQSRFKCGALAKKAACRGGGTSFQGFKMRLGEKEAELLRSGTPEAQLPRALTRQYVKTLLSRFLRDVQRGGAPRIDELVVCVPAIWYEGKNADNRTRLMDVCCGVLEELLPGPAGGKKRVRTLSEPVAASMFFVDRYQKKTKAGFSGCLLLVDYGGGTLDVTLCRIAPKVLEDGSTRPMVSLQGMWGAGENTTGRIGQAGMAYLQAVMETAWQEQQGAPLPPKDSAYWDGVYTLEDELRSIEGQEEIEAAFALAVDPAALEGEAFRSIDFCGQTLCVSFGLLYRAYDAAIRPVLHAALSEAKAFLAREGLEGLFADPERFKIAMAGGFCNFYLVRRQILQELDCLEDDRRILNDRRGNCEQAIAYGAALKANDRMEDQLKAPYFLGIHNKEPRGDVAYWAVRKGDTIRYGEPQWIRLYDPKKKQYGEFGEFAFTNISRLAIHSGDDPAHAYTGELPEEAKEQLNRVSAANTDLLLRYRIGFVFDESSILWILFEEGRYDGGKWVSRRRIGPIRLNGIGDILGPRMLNTPEPVIDGGV